MPTSQQSELSTDDALKYLQGAKPKAPSKPKKQEQDLSTDEALKYLQQGSSQGGGKGFIPGIGPFVGSALEGLGQAAKGAGAVLDYLGSVDAPSTYGSRGPLPSWAGGVSQTAGITPGAEAGAQENIAQPLQQTAEAVYPQESRGTGGLLSEKIPALVGRIAPGIAATAVAGPGAGGAYFGLDMGGQAYDDVLQKTGDTDKAAAALVGNAAIAQLQEFGIGGQVSKVLQKLSRGSGGTLGLWALLTAPGKHAAQATGVGVMQQALSDLLSEQLTGEDIKVLDRAKELLKDPALPIVGAATGLFSALADLKPRKAPQEAPGAKQAPEAPKAAAETKLVPEEVQEPQKVSGEPGPAQAAKPPADGTREEPQRPPVSEETVPPKTTTEEVTKTSGPNPSQETTGIPPSESGRAGPSDRPAAEATGIKNSTVEKELKDIGLPMPKGREKKTFVEMHARAMETLKQDPQAGQKLVGELEHSKRPHTDEEVALLTLEANRLRQERLQAHEAAIADPTPENLAREQASIDAYRRAADVFERTGSESGASLGARRQMVNADYSLAEMERRLETAKGRKLTPEERTTVAEQAKKIADLEAKHTAYVSEAEAKNAELAAENAYLKLQKQVVGKTKGPRSTKHRNQIAEAKKNIERLTNELAVLSKRARAGLDPETAVKSLELAREYVRLGYHSFAEFAHEVASRVGEHVRPYLKMAWDKAQHENVASASSKVRQVLGAEGEIGGAVKEIKSLAEAVVRKGVHSRQQMVDEVHAEIVQHRPEVTKEDVQNAIAEYGKFRRPTKLEAKQQLQKYTRELRALTGKDKGPRLQAQKTRLQNEIKALKERIANKDFGKSAPRPVELDEAAIKLKGELEHTKHRFAAAEEKARLEARSRAEKVRDAAKEVLDLPRALFSAFDFSAVRRQGGFYSSSRPVTSGRAMKRMFKAVKSARDFHEVDAAIRARPGHALSEAAGLELTSIDSIGPREEAIRSQWSDKIPGIPASNRAYVAFLNAQRAAVFDSIVESLPHKIQLSEAKAIAEFVNAATGRPSGKFSDVAARLERVKIFWAPKYAASRFQLLGKPLTLWFDKRLSFPAKRALAKDFVKYAAGQSLYYSLIASLGVAMGQKTTVEKDPRSSDFGKVRIGNARVDPLSGLSQVAAFLARMATGKTKTSSGAVKELKPGGPYDQTRFDVALRFIRSKTGPVPSRIWDALAGETYTGEKVTPAEALLQIPVPGAIGDIYESMRQMGVPQATILGVFSLFGDGLATYDNTKKKK